VRWMNDNAPKNAKVHFLPNNWEYERTWKWYRQGKDLRADIANVNNESSADLVVITHERRFARYGDDLKRYRHKKILAEKIVDGSPIWTIVQAR
jgi:hypothetical protein